MNKKIIFILVVTISFLGLSCHKNEQIKTSSTNVIEESQTSYDTPIMIGPNNFIVEVVRDQDRQMRGLSGRDGMLKNNGMLFDFTITPPYSRSFWMKDMKFDLDLIWIYGNKIIGITKKVPRPKDENEPLPTYSSPGSVDMVLEINSGLAEQLNIKVGDEIIFLK